MQKSTSHSPLGRYRRMVLALVADSTITSFAPGRIAPIPSSSPAPCPRRPDAPPLRFLAAAVPLPLARAVVVAASAVRGRGSCRCQSRLLLPMPTRWPRRWERERSIVGLVVVGVGGTRKAAAAARHDERSSRSSGSDGQPVLPCHRCRRCDSCWLRMLPLLLPLVGGSLGKGEAAASDQQ